jgi:hypothetical protein
MKKSKTRSFYLFVSTLIIGLFSFPFAFAKTVEKRSKALYHTVTDSSGFYNNLTPSILSSYDRLQLELSGVNRSVFELAEKGFEKLIEQGRLLNDSIISVIDFSLPSSVKRLFVLDIKNNRLLANTYVAHGRNSGQEYANSFSNNSRSFKSSLGFYITGNTYIGGHGYSLKLKGLENGINDNAEKRAVVIHGADYVSEELIRSQGYIGRSLGCPAVSEKEINKIINFIKDGSCLFIYHPQKSYQQQSSLLN